MYIAGLDLCLSAFAAPVCTFCRWCCKFLTALVFKRCVCEDRIFYSGLLCEPRGSSGNNGRVFDLDGGLWALPSFWLQPFASTPLTISYSKWLIVAITVSIFLIYCFCSCLTESLMGHSSLLWWIRIMCVGSQAIYIVHTVCTATFQNPLLWMHSSGIRAFI